MGFHDFYKRNCHTPLLRPWASLGKAVNRFYENRNYNHQTNGENRVLEILSRRPCDSIFDVGANRGTWARNARTHFPNARIYCFEPVPEVHAELKELESDAGIRTFNLALGAARATATFHHYPNGNELSSLYRFELHRETPQLVSVEVWSGDDFMEKNEINRIDVLKIDTEGHDLEVLRGFDRHLKNRSIGVIQFEYGRINILSKALLRDFFEYLTPLDYRIGKIYPKSVDFRDYNFDMEDFIGPNFLAVPARESELISALLG